MARPESADLSNIDDCIAAILAGHERIAIVLLRSAHRLIRMDIGELVALDEDLKRLQQYLLRLRPLASQSYQNGKHL